MTTNKRATFESARKLATPPVGSEVHAVHSGIPRNILPAPTRPAPPMPVCKPPKNEGIDYRLLLVKYMGHVIDMQGGFGNAEKAFTRDEDRPLLCHGVTFTDEQWASLQTLADSLNY